MPEQNPDHRTVSVDSYRYGIYSSIKNSGDNAVIELIKDNRRIAWLHFTNDYTLKRPHMNKEGEYELYYSYSELPNLVDMLRNEKPIYLLWRGESDTRVSTNIEPTGEGE